MMSPPDLRGTVGQLPDHILRMSEGYDHADAVRGALDADVDDLTTGVIFVGLAVLALGLFMWGAM